MVYNQRGIEQHLPARRGITAFDGFAQQLRRDVTNLPRTLLHIGEKVIRA